MHPPLPDGLTPVPPGKLASIVTHLEMREPPAPRPDPPGLSGLALARIERPELAAYRALFRAVGDAWLWTSRLAMADEALRAILRDPAVEVYALAREGRDVGLMELDLRAPHECELVYFGLVPEAVGLGLGRFLMNRAIERAFSSPGTRRVWVHTCDLDHPGALAFYRRSGFTPFRREVELLDDPRLTGLIREDAAPHIPLIRPATAVG